jgi:hypothetical protein
VQIDNQSSAEFSSVQLKLERKLVLKTTGAMDREETLEVAHAGFPGEWVGPANDWHGMMPSHVQWCWATAQSSWHRAEMITGGACGQAELNSKGSVMQGRSFSTGQGLLLRPQASTLAAISRAPPPSHTVMVLALCVCFCRCRPQ